MKKSKRKVGIVILILNKMTLSQKELLEISHL